MQTGRYRGCIPWKKMAGNLPVVSIAIKTILGGVLGVGGCFKMFCYLLNTGDERFLKR